MTYSACDCDYDPAEFSYTKTRKARKPYSCYECGGSIAPGEAYEITVGKWDGDLCTYRTCALCAELRQWAVVSVPCFCWIYGHLHENVRDMVKEVSPDVPGMIFEWGRRMVKINRQSHADDAIRE